MAKVSRRSRIIAGANRGGSNKKVCTTGTRLVSRLKYDWAVLDYDGYAQKNVEKGNV